MSNPPGQASSFTDKLLTCEQLAEHNRKKHGM